MWSPFCEHCEGEHQKILEMLKVAIFGSRALGKFYFLLFTFQSYLKFYFVMCLDILQE
jgi:hypothetical protein